MDTWSAPEAAHAAGVLLPTAQALLDRAGVPRTRRGVPRRAPAVVARSVAASLAPGYRSSEIAVLAALRVSPLGLDSVRRIARVAGCSPMTASVAVARLVAAGLVAKQSRRTVSAGRVVEEDCYRLDVRSPQWNVVGAAVRATRLPERDGGAGRQVPRAYWVLFWNADPTHLRIVEDGAYVAQRMLTGDSTGALRWALENLRPTDLIAATRGRGVDARVRALVRNWATLASDEPDG